MCDNFTSKCESVYQALCLIEFQLCASECFSSCENISLTIECEGEKNIQFLSVFDDII